MSVNRKIAESLERLTFEHREADFHHHSYDEDIRQYEYIKRGDLQSLEEGRRMFEGPTTGSLSDDPVTNYKYLFVASITLACRFCIEGGMPAEVAFNLSDLYIRQADRCGTVDEIFSLHNAMFRDYTVRMQGILRWDVYSRPVHRCMDYIDQHLQQPLTQEEQALTQRAAAIIRKDITVPCTACRYCASVCPRKIAIPDCFSVYNTIKRYGGTAMTDVYNYYNNLIQMYGRPSDCVKCGKCEQRCPQHLKIRELLVDVKQTLE